MRSPNETLSPQEIADLEEDWKEERLKITLWQSPCRTLYLFSLAACKLTHSTAKYLISHPVMLRFLTPMFLLWVTLEYIPGPYTSYIDTFEFCIEYVVWWVGLGILSSIGLGSGLQTGVLFLFPHIMRVCLTAQTCKSVNFKSFEAIWFRHPHDLFKCTPATDDDPPYPATYFAVWFLVLVPSFLQATGTAIGEIPPYWMTRAAREAAIEAGDRSEVPEELETNSKFSFINRVKGRMIVFLRTHGFLGVFLMAAWPNFAFDLCGICCGHFLMPFWTFFGATFVGKACVRNTYQTLIMVALFSEKYLEIVIRTLQSIVPDSFHLDTFIREALEDFQDSSQKELKKQQADASAVNSGESPPETTHHGHSTLANLWSTFLACILIYFTLSCVQHFAQFYQAMLDKEKSDSYKMKLPSHVKKSLLSPVSGRIKLPPPTPKSVRNSSTAGESGTEARRTGGAVSKTGGGGGSGNEVGSIAASRILEGSSQSTFSSPEPARRSKSTGEISHTPSTSLALFQSPISRNASESKTRVLRLSSPVDGGDDSSSSSDSPEPVDRHISMSPSPPRTAGRISSSSGVLAAIDANKMRHHEGARRNYSYSMGGSLFTPSVVDRENSLRTGQDKSK